MFTAMGKCRACNASLIWTALILYIFIRLITSNPNFEEIDFEHNHIGDAAGREILHAMQQRKEG